MELPGCPAWARLRIPVLPNGDLQMVDSDENHLALRQDREDAAQFGRQEPGEGRHILLADLACLLLRGLDGRHAVQHNNAKTGGVGSALLDHHVEDALLHLGLAVLLVRLSAQQLENVSAGVRLHDAQTRQIDSKARGPARVERVLSVDEKGPVLWILALPLADRHQREQRFAAALVASQLDQASLGPSPDADRLVQRGASGGFGNRRLDEVAVGLEQPIRSEGLVDLLPDAFHCALGALFSRHSHPPTGQARGIRQPEGTA